ncbi:hypothetical protein BD626DRAFT_413194 [Schizophyllum amplum]|uniref:MYND-type domain-containing protein n=1 Tax=Schizophyllum amplum TaxID=97359 RepID=A0A550BW35_9AGAR|nr:hypothetical protein BD626DRAFT_413194 [Auriculariopsis ampla]
MSDRTRRGHTILSSRVTSSKETDVLRSKLLHVFNGLPVPLRKRSCLEIKAILDRGRAFPLLTQEYSLSSLDESDRQLGGPFVKAVTNELHALTLLYDVCEYKEYHPLASYSPVSLEDIFRWLDFLHPMNGRLLPTPTTSDYIEILVKVELLLEYLFRSPNDVLVDYLCDNTHSMRMIIDLWLHYHCYVSPKSRYAQVLAFGLSRAASLLHQDLGRVTGGQEVFAEQLLALEAHSRRRVLRCLAMHSRFLQQLRNLEFRYEKIWKMYFVFVSDVLHLTKFHAVIAPKAFVDAFNSGLLHITRFPEKQGMNDGASIAFGALRSLFHVINLRRLIARGMFPVLVKCERTWSRGLTLEGHGCDMTFGDQLSFRLVAVSVLRAFHARHSDLLQPVVRDTFIEDRFKGLLGVYRTIWPQYLHLRETQSWKWNIPCANRSESAQHEPNVRACAQCGRVFYCSKRCQREHWREKHREECTRSYGIWGYRGQLTLEDAVFCIMLAQYSLRRDRNQIKQELTERMSEWKAESSSE